MARTTKRGTCELCGASANVGMNHGSKVCPQCTHVQSALNNRIESVAMAARSMGKTEELLGYLIPAGGGIAVKMTADFLQEISGIVGYDGEDPQELVAAVRKRVLTCASCEAEDDLGRIADVIGYTGVRGDGLVEAVRERARTCEDCGAADDTAKRIKDVIGYTGEDPGELVAAVINATKACASCDAESVLHEIREIVEYSPDMGDSGLADAVRSAVSAKKATALDCGDCALADCFNDLADLVDKRGASPGLVIKAVRALIVTPGTAPNADAMREDFERALQEIETVSAKLTLAEQSRDEWEQRAVLAESNVETMEAELRNRDAAPAAPSLGYCCTDSGLLDIALKALRGDGPDADQLATLIDAARRAA